MKKRYYFLLVLLFLCVETPCQRIQYSRQSAIINFPDATQLVPNLSGYHHLVSLTFRKKPQVNIFDPQLQLISTIELPFKIPDYSEVKFLGFSNFYYMYIQTRRTGTYELWKIDSKGNATSLTEPFTKVIKSHFARNAATFQLINNHNRLYIIAHTYFSALEKVETVVVNADEMMNLVSVQKGIYDFNAAAEVLQQVMLLNNNHLLVMKNSKSYLVNNTLELMKVDLDSGLVVSTTFNSSNSAYSEPSFNYNYDDSTITVYSLIRGAISGRVQRSVLICQLDNSLKEKVPLSLLKSQFRSDALASFLLIDGKEPLWIGYQSRLPYRVYTTYGGGRFGYGYPDEQLLRRMPMMNNLPDRYYRDTYEQSNAIRFTILNNQLKPADDSLVVNSKSSYGIQPQQYARFTINNKSYLLFNQKFSSNRRGILMVYGGEDKQLEITDVRVNDRYDYLLTQLQVLPGHAVLLPYVHRREAGLVKLTYD